MLLSLIIFTSLKLNAGTGDAAGGSYMSWREILENRFLVPDSPQVKFGNKRVSLLETCTPDGGETIRTKKKIATGNSWINVLTPANERSWEGSVRKYLSTPRIFSKLICFNNNTKDKCEFIQVEEYYPLETIIPVRVSSNTDHSFGRVVFEKEFYLPNCED